MCLGPIGRDGVYPANRASRGCDVLLALGTRFGDRSASSWRDGVTHQIPPQKLIHVDQDSGQFGRNYPPAVGITASAGLVVQQMVEQVLELPEGTRISRISADTCGSEKETLIRVDPQHPLDPRASLL